MGNKLKKGEICTQVYIDEQIITFRVHYELGTFCYTWLHYFYWNYFTIKTLIVLATKVEITTYGAEK